MTILLTLVLYDYPKGYLWNALLLTPKGLCKFKPYASFKFSSWKQFLFSNQLICKILLGPIWGQTKKNLFRWFWFFNDQDIYILIVSIYFMPISRNNSKINKCKITRGPWNTWFLGRKKRCSLKFKLLLLYIWNYLVQCWYNDSKLKTMHYQGPCTLILHASRMPCTLCTYKIREIQTKEPW